MSQIDEDSSRHLRREKCIYRKLKKLTEILLASGAQPSQPNKPHNDVIRHRVCQSPQAEMRLGSVHFLAISHFISVLRRQCWPLSLLSHELKDTSWSPKGLKLDSGPTKDTVRKG